MFGSRNKGASAEREVAHMLQEWWKKIDPEAIFKRTPSSGGWASKDARSQFSTSGDLVCKAKGFPWTVEIKRREAFNWKNVLEGKASPVWGWWQQAQTQAKEQGLEPMLWFRKNRTPWSVMMTSSYAQKFFLRVGYRWVIPQTEKVRQKIGADAVVIIDAASLLCVHPSDFAKVYS